jgi:cation:H+ antiporter
MLPLVVAIPFFVIGIVLLIKGSDILVEGSSKTALRFGIPVFVISAVIIGFGTSAPELTVSVGAGLENDAGISLGNIVGSCIANIFLILGIAAIMKPVKIKNHGIRKESMIVLFSSIVLLLFAIGGLLDDYHLLGGAIFLLLFIGSLYVFVQSAKQQKQNFDMNNKDNLNRYVLLIILGIIGVLLGAWLLIESTISIATALNIPSFFIALSVIAVGTSLPELMVTITASRKDASDITLGNILGSNVFNIFLILGLSALLIPLDPLKEINSIIFLLIATICLFVFLYTGTTLNKKIGLIFLITYILFICYSAIFI